jgi:nucleotide-binding universal stress UspA family protein
VSFLRRRSSSRPGASGRRILFPFIGSTISQRTLEATLRLARAQDAVLMPAYLATIPRELSLDSPAPLRESEAALPMLELIEQRATQVSVAVDSRIERGRSPRHALAELIDAERYDILVVPAKTSTSDGFDPADIAWLLENAPGEVLVLRPAPADSAQHANSATLPDTSSS